MKRDLEWLGSSKKDLLGLPEDVIDFFGHHLWEVQNGQTPTVAKVLSGFGGAGVLELIDDFSTDTYRAVYTVRYEEAVYVLHCFMKQSKRGIETPKQDVDKIKQRLKMAEERHREWLESQPKQSKKKK